MTRQRSLSSAESLARGIGRLYDHLPGRRKRELSALLAFSVVGGVAEVVTIGALMPFLALLSDQSGLATNPVVEKTAWLLALIDPGNMAIAAGLLVLSAAILSGGVRVLLAYFGHAFVNRVGHDLTLAVFTNELYCPYSQHIDRNSSELVAGVTKVQLLVTQTFLPLLQIAINLVVVLLIFAALVAIHPVIALSAVGIFAIIYVAVAVLTREALKRNSVAIAAAQSTRVRAVQEGLGGIRDVLLDHSQPYFIEKLRASDRAMRRASTGNMFIGTSPRFLADTASIVAVLGLAFFFSRQPGGLSAAIPLLGAFALGARRILPAFQSIYSSWAQIKGGEQMIIDVLELLNRRVGAPPGARESLARPETSPLPFEREIRLSDVSFGYAKGRQRILAGVDLSIRKGERIGLVGRTGSGKSTLADLIMGLLEPTSGRMLIDGTPVTSDNMILWQSNVAHVAQSVYLADTTLAENIAFCVPAEEVDRDRIADAVRKAALESFVDGLPEGLDTVVGERGIRLSGGQKQRIGIARAIYNRADLIVFDEATNALDEQTESEVIDAIRTLGRNVTIIMIAHRASSIDWCDQVYRIEEGRLAGRDSS